MINIAIVEDEGLTVLFLNEVLSELGHSTKGIFDNAEETMTFLKQTHVDLVFMDIEIAGALDGIQTAERIHRRYPKVKFIFLTSYKDSDTIQRAQNVKPIGYLIKPVIQSDIEAIMMVAQGQVKKDSKEGYSLQLGEYTYNMNEKILQKDQNPIRLTKNEQQCFHELVLHRDMYVSAEHLISAIWGDEDNRIASLRELTSRLRKKLSGLTLENIPKVGYILHDS